MDSRENKATIKTGEFMKKLGTLLLTLVLAFTLCACDTEKKEAVKKAIPKAEKPAAARKAIEKAPVVQAEKKPAAKRAARPGTKK